MLLDMLKKFFVVSVFADDEETEDDVIDTEEKTVVKKNPSRVNYEQLIEQARNEEKNKLYPKIKKLETELKKTMESLNNALLREGALKLEFDKIKSGPSKEVEELKKELETLKEENEKLKADAPKEEEIRKTLEEEYKVKIYIQEKIAEHKEDILPMLHETITGKTTKEVDESVEKAKEKTIQVKKELGLIDEDGKETEEGKKDKKEDKKESKDDDKEEEKKVVKKKPPTVSPSGIVSGKKTYTAEDVRNMSPEEYKAFRKEIRIG